MRTCTTPSCLPVTHTRRRRILQKHLKRQIISLSGGFQVIADLNAYHTFITSLRVPSIISEFSYLKMLGHVYVVEDAKDLAQIVRDVTRYGGAYRPEVNVQACRATAQPNPCDHRTSTSSSSGDPTGRRLKRRSTKRCTTSPSKKTALSHEVVPIAQWDAHRLLRVSPCDLSAPAPIV